MEELEKVEQVPEQDLKLQSPKSVSRTLAITSLSIAIFMIFLSGLFDFLAFKDAILTFIAGLLVTAAATVIIFMAFIASLVLIFGIIILQNNGFWPINAIKNVFIEIMGSVEILPEQLAAFRIYRIILLVLFVGNIILASIAVVKYKKEKALKLVKPFDNTKPMAITALVFACIGAAISIASIFLTSIL